MVHKKCSLLKEFVSRNEEKFCRQVKLPGYSESKTMTSEGADVIFDQEVGSAAALSSLSFQRDDRIISFAFTGSDGSVTSRVDGEKGERTDMGKEGGLRITELSTVFRSTR